MVNMKPTCSRERPSQILGIKYSLIPLHRDLEATTKNLRDRQVPHNENETGRHVNIVE